MANLAAYFKYVRLLFSFCRHRWPNGRVYAEIAMLNHLILQGITLTFLRFNCSKKVHQRQCVQKTHYHHSENIIFRSSCSLLIKNRKLCNRIEYRLNHDSWLILNKIFTKHKTHPKIWSFLRIIVSRVTAPWDGRLGVTPTKQLGDGIFLISLPGAILFIFRRAVLKRKHNHAAAIWRMLIICLLIILTGKSWSLQLNQFYFRPRATFHEKL